MRTGPGAAAAARRGSGSRARPAPPPPVRAGHVVPSLRARDPVALGLCSLPGPAPAATNRRKGGRPQGGSRGAGCSEVGAGRAARPGAALGAPDLQAPSLSPGPRQILLYARFPEATRGGGGALHRLRFPPVEGNREGREGLRGANPSSLRPGSRGSCGPGAGARLAVFAHPR